jgi:exonuclease III
VERNLKEIYKIMTLNINGVAAKERLDMLEGLLVNEVDVAMLQEVVSTQLQCVRNYECHLNIGTEMRGTVLLVREGLTISDLKRIPPGRGIAPKFGNTWLVNIHAPSGAERREERERLFTTDIQVLPPVGEEFVLGGDFNCVLDPGDATGRPNISRALGILVKGLCLKDAWSQRNGRVFTH